MTRLTIALACLASLAFTPSCGNDCETDDADEPVVFDGGAVLEGGTSYESSDWNGTPNAFVHFPPGRRLILMHRLGRVPTSIKTYVSFSEKGVGVGDGGNNVAESAGNQVVIEAATEESVQVRNDSCADFYLRIVVSIDSPPADAGVGDSSITDAAGGG